MPLRPTLAALVALSAASAPAAVLSSLQRGSATLQSGPTTTQALVVPIAPVDPTRAFLVFSVRGSTTEPGDGQVRGRLNAASVVFSRGNRTSLSALAVEWYVAEFSSGVVVQRGTAAVSDTGAVTLAPAVNLARSFVLISQSSPGTSTSFASDDYVRARLTSSTQLELRLDSALQSPVEWQVIEFTGASVQRGSGTLSLGSSSVVRTIASVSTASSFVITTWKTDGAGADDAHLTASFLSGTQVELRRGDNDGNVDYAFEVVTFTDGTTVRSGAATFASTATSLSATLAPAVAPGRSLAFLAGNQRYGRTSYNADDNPGPGWFTAGLTSPTTLDLARQFSGSSGATVNWFVVDFAPAANGSPCGSTGACASTFCENGRCCATACGGATPDCQACSLAAGGSADGVCSTATAGASCRAAAGVCDLGEVCDGASPTCPADAFDPTPGAVCRPLAGTCDVVAETCTGFSPSCPADSFAPGTVACRAASDLCDAVEFCSGSAVACPPDELWVTTTCRAVAGTCDRDEFCPGDDVACPADGFAASGTGCRLPAGACDVQESCSGSAATCPSDAFLTSSTLCRGPAGACDVQESCSGSAATCPPDVFQTSSTVCRGSAGACDVAEACDGTLPNCPGDGFAAQRSPGAPSCAPLSCNGATAGCPQRCAAALDCVAGSVCSQGQCVPGMSFTTSPSSAATCGRSFNFQPTLTGGLAPFTFELQAGPGETLPAGLRVNQATGEVSWTPSRADEGQHRVRLLAIIDGAQVEQELEITVDCVSASMGVGCSCASPAGSLLGLSLGLMLWAGRRRRG